MKTLYLDCPTGIAGDMLLAALIEAGNCEEQVQKQLQKLPLQNWELQIKQTCKNGLAASQAEVSYAHAMHEHRSLNDITDIINNAELSPAVMHNALQTFNILAEAEAKVHGCHKEEIHFHEVGAIDAIIDIVGNCIAIDILGIEQTFCSALPMGKGTVCCAHGILPLPAPATAELLKGFAVYGTDLPGETVTPTGAALLNIFVGKDKSIAMPAMTIQDIGQGAGTKDFDRPNILRAIIGDIADEPLFSLQQQAQSRFLQINDKITVLTTALDDCNPEILGALWEHCFEAGALDIYYTAIIMKKGRPGTELTLICQSEQAAQMAELIFLHTTTAGIRVHEEKRFLQTRKIISVHTAYGEIDLKILGEENIYNAAPEFESCHKAARQHKIPVKRVYDAAIAAYYKKI